ncbi:hypothetical protein BDQ17DRAFT_1258948, partial [Cyathus striatus]
VGFDLNSKGHHIYWEEKRSVSIEQSIVFHEIDLPVIEEIDDVTLKGEEEEEEVQDEDEDIKSERDIEHRSTPIPSPAVLPLPPTAPIPPTRPTRVRKESQYVKDL